MKIIFLTGEQGTLKTSLWGAAISDFLRQRGQTVAYLDYMGEDQAHFEAIRAENPDWIIVDTCQEAFPFAETPDFTVSVSDSGQP